MAQQIEHTRECVANRGYRMGIPLTDLRSRTLARCTLSPAELGRFMAERGRWSFRTALWLEHSFLMVRTQDGYRITKAGEAALRLAFHAAMSGWKMCRQCARVKAPKEFIGKSGKAIRYCQDCVAQRATRS